MIPKQGKSGETEAGESELVGISRRRILKTSAGLSITGLAGCEEGSSEDSIPDEEQRQPGEGHCKNQYEQPGGTCNSETPLPVYLIRKRNREAAEFVLCPVAVAGSSFVIALATPAAAAALSSTSVVSVGVTVNQKLLKKGLMVCADEYGEMKAAEHAVKEEIERRKKEAQPTPD